MSSSDLRRVLLVGFMGAGKTSVGRAVAAGLGWRFEDFDEAVEAEAGASIPDLFRERGEAAFRRLEEGVAERLLSENQVVLGSGGGWAAVEGRLADLPPGTATFWLRVSPETAVRRASEQAGRRPLLESDDPVRRASELLSERVGAYRHARWAVDTEGSTVDDVSARILAILATQFPKIGR